MHMDLAFSLRPAVSDDLPVVRVLLQRAKLTENHVESQFGSQFVVATADATGEVVGAAGIECYGDSGAVSGLFRSAVVDDRWRGGGIGAALTRNRIAWAEQQQLQALYLLTQTAADYWPKFGFVRIARDDAPPALQQAHEWTSGCPASAVAMRMAVAGSGSAIAWCDGALRLRRRAPSHMCGIYRDAIARIAVTIAPFAGRTL
jgi:amino-acid N-acetyltransferase